MDVFEAMGTCTAMRYLKPDPVPEELIEKLLWAATRASNPGNSQAWEFVVLRDAEKKRVIGEAVARGMQAVRAQRPRGESPAERRMLTGANHLLENLGRAPVLIFVCGRNLYPPGRPLERFVWSAVYPAGQNLIVAARALGLGTVFTTFHMVAEPVVRETLGIPDDVQIGLMIPVGYPERSFRPVTRKPVQEVLHWDRW
jgi:nitroreductase